jgi:hypothetical protein
MATNQQLGQIDGRTRRVKTSAEACMAPNKAKEALRSLDGCARARTANKMLRPMSNWKCRG